MGFVCLLSFGRVVFSVTHSRFPFSVLFQTGRVFSFLILKSKNNLFPQVLLLLLKDNESRTIDVNLLTIAFMKFLQLFYIFFGEFNISSFLGQICLFDNNTTTYVQLVCFNEIAKVYEQEVIIFQLNYCECCDPSIIFFSSPYCIDFLKFVTKMKKSNINCKCISYISFK